MQVSWCTHDHVRLYFFYRNIHLALKLVFVSQCESPTACQIPESSTFVARRSRRRKKKVDSWQIQSFYSLTFLCIWCQLLFVWWVLFILFPKDSTLKRGNGLENVCDHWCVYLWFALLLEKFKILVQWKILHMYLWMFLYLLFLPSKEGMLTGPAATGQTGWIAQWSTTAILRTEQPASLETRSVSPVKHNK